MVFPNSEMLHTTIVPDRASVQQSSRNFLQTKQKQKQSNPFPSPASTSASSQAQTGVAPANSYSTPLRDVSVQPLAQDPIYFNTGGTDSNYREFSLWHDAKFVATVVDFDHKQRKRAFWCVNQLAEYERAVMLGDRERSQEVLRVTSVEDLAELGKSYVKVTKAGTVKSFDTDAYLKSFEKALHAKFGAAPGILLATLGRDLIYAKNQDRVLGIGYLPRYASANAANWGENKYGKLLQRVRDKIAQSDRVAKDVFFYLGPNNKIIFHDPALDTAWDEQADQYSFDTDMDITFG